MTMAMVLVGGLAVLVGLVTLVLRVRWPHKLWKLDAMRESWGSRGGLFHAALFSLAPLLAGGALLAVGLSRSLNETNQQRGMLFKVSKEDASQHAHYILGTSFALTKDDAPLPGEIEQAFRKSVALVVDLDPNNVDPTHAAAVVRAQGFYSDHEEAYPLRRSTRDRLKELLTDREQSVAKFTRPWFLAVRVALKTLEEQGLDPKTSIEQHFLGEGRAEITVKELVPLHRSFDHLTSLGEADQEAFLHYTLVDMDRIDTGKEELKQAWLAGDLRRYAQCGRKIGMGKEEKALLEKVYRKKNGVLLEGLEPLLASERTHFALVPMSSLIGPWGLLSALQERGFEVRQVPELPLLHRLVHGAQDLDTRGVFDAMQPTSLKQVDPMIGLAATAVIGLLVVVIGVLLTRRGPPRVKRPSISGVLAPERSHGQLSESASGGSSPSGEGKRATGRLIGKPVDSPDSERPVSPEEASDAPRVEPAVQGRVHVASSRVRCPYCHDELSPERGGWVACEGCLARHHQFCWWESGKCSACGVRRSLASSAPVQPRPIRRWMVVAVVAAGLLALGLYFGFQTRKGRSPAGPSAKSTPASGAPGPSERKNVPQVERGLSSRDEHKRLAAIQALAGREGYQDKAWKSASELVEIARDPTVRRKLIIAMGRLGSRAVPHLSNLARQRTNPLRGLAYTSLGRIGPPAESALLRLLATEKGHSKVLALRALCRFKPGSSALYPLRQLLQHRNPEVRSLAAKALGAMGREANPAVRDLQRLANSRDPARGDARRALRRIGRSK